MVELVVASIMDGTDNNHGMSDQIISIIQMQQAWVTVIMEQITLDTPLMLQDIIKVIMAAQISSMTTRTTALVHKATNPEAEVGDEAATVVVVMGMVQMKPSHNSSHSSLAKASNRMDQLVRQDRFPQGLKLMLLLLLLHLIMWMSSVEKYAQSPKRKKTCQPTPRMYPRMTVQPFRRIISWQNKTATETKPQIPSQQRLQMCPRMTILQDQSKL
jgi:hypothetical protein